MIDENMKEPGNSEFIDSSKALDFVKDEINRILLRSPAIIRKYTSHLATSSGKYIRAVSLLACAQNKDGLVHNNAVKLAAAVEILHLATLVHDDIIDDADIRRGEPSLQKKHGKRTAVICGDYLLCMALKIAAGTSEKENYLKLDVPDYMTRICLGELNQHINNGFVDISVHQYFKIISGKTAALFEASFYAGAVLSGEDERAIKKYKRLGRYTGMIFQMSDDCIDFENDRDKAKKPVQSDFEQGVVTLPLINAFMKMPEFKDKAKSGEVTRNDINNAVSKSGGIQFTRKVSKMYYDKSMAIIDGLDITADKKTKLKAILARASGIC